MCQITHITFESLTLDGRHKVMYKVSAGYCRSCSLNQDKVFYAAHGFRCGVEAITPADDKRVAEGDVRSRGVADEQAASTKRCLYFTLLSFTLWKARVRYDEH